MKRCPECDFLYEDEQRLCDMDGTALVPESHGFPDSAHSARRVSRRLWQRVVIAFPLVVLAVLGFYVFKYQQRVPTTHQTPAVEAAPASNTTNATEVKSSEAAQASEKENAVEPGDSQPSRTVANENKSKARREKAEEPDSASANPDRAVEPKAPAAVPPSKPAEKPLRPQNSAVKKVSNGNDQNRDSKVTSFLKKTARLLKKPFKF